MNNGEGPRMDSSLKNLLPIVVAVILGVVSVIAVNRYISARTQAEDVKKASIVTAAQTIGAGTEIDFGHLDVKEVPAELVSGVNITVPGGTSAQAAEEIQLRKAMLVGRRPVRLIPAGDPILWTDFAKAEADSLSDKIPEGRRAVTIPVDALTGVGLNIVPGDRVDILGSKDQGCGSGGAAIGAINPSMVRDLMGGAGAALSNPAGAEGMVAAAKPPVPEAITYVLMQNVLVLAVGQEFNPDVIGSGRATSYGNVTLEVSLAEAVMLAHARNQATLSLVLRPQAGLDRLPSDQLLAMDCPAIMKRFAQELDAQRAAVTAPPSVVPAQAPDAPPPGGTP
jgi:Flp pilus assembly protein CpaB